MECRGGGARQLLVWTGLRSALQRGDLALGARRWQILNQLRAAVMQALRSGRSARLQLDNLASMASARVI